MIEYAFLKLEIFLKKCVASGPLKDDILNMLHYSPIDNSVKESESSRKSENIEKKIINQQDNKKCTEAKGMLFFKEIGEHWEENKRSALHKWKVFQGSIKKQSNNRTETSSKTPKCGKRIKKLVGFKAIKLCKSENRMNVALQSLVDIFEAENDKNSENNSTNDLLMMFNKYF